MCKSSLIRIKKSILVNLFGNICLNLHFCAVQRRRVLGFICQVFSVRGIVFAWGVKGVTEAHPSPRTLSFPSLLSTSSSCCPGRSQTIVVVTAVPRAAVC